jgi:acyl-CoA reductase-like NAD-dependent aldehyde dehydrogenase
MRFKLSALALPDPQTALDPLKNISYYKIGFNIGKSIVDLPSSRLLIDGAWCAGASRLPVLDKYTLLPFAEIEEADATHVQRAADGAARSLSRMPDPYERAQILFRVRDIVRAELPRFQNIMVIEAGFPLADAKGEIERAIHTLTACAEEAKRIAGEVIPFSGTPGGAKRLGYTVRVPIGIVAAITPFNAPLNTVCHKIGPAFAAGNAVILKPAATTPFTAALIVEAFMRAGAPEGSISLLHGPGAAVGKALLDDDRIGFFAFTGSTPVGKAIHAGAGLRKTQMELGSIAGTIVMDDADLDRAAEKAAASSFRKAGQVCTSVQLLMVQHKVYERFRDAYLARVRPIAHGDPKRAETQVGPVISMRDADRIDMWIREARDGGATVTCNGERDRAVLAPTVIENAHDQMHVMKDEIFGPVVCLVPFDTDAQAFARINATPYGLATGVFTGSLGRAIEATRCLHVGAVHINETCSSRVDIMPYGGVKDSGFGHEGPKYAMREMSEERLITIAT